MTQLEQSQKKIFANYTANETDSVLLVDTTNQVVEIYVNKPLTNDSLIIKDLGNASNNKIIVRSNELINGFKHYEIVRDLDVLELQFDSNLNTYKGTLLVKGATSILVSEDYTANANDLVVMSTGQLDKIVTLPLNPKKDDIVRVTKSDDSNGKVVISGNGNFINSSSNDEIVYQYTFVSYHFDGNIWRKF